MGLVSDGGVHSDVEHLLALIDAAADAGVPATSHAFTDAAIPPRRSPTDSSRT